MAAERRLGVYTLTGLVIANMIGAGVFTTSGFAIGDLGSPGYVMLAWVVGGLIALCGALSYGALARLMPESGGEYYFLSRTVHPMVGFIAGWVSLLAGFTGAIAYAATAFEAYLLPAGVRATLPDGLIATAVIILAALSHGLHLGQGTRLQNLTVVVKLILIAGLMVYVLTGSAPASWDGVRAWQGAEPVPFSIQTFAMSLMWISFSYSGFNAAIYIAGEVREPSTTLPRAMFLGTLLTMVIYLLLNALFVLAPAPDLIRYQQDVAAIAATVIGGDGLALFVRALICLALYTSVSAMIMIGPRVYARMADDGLMPGRLRFNNDLPTTAIFTQAVLAIIVVWISSLQELLSYLGFTLGLSTVITIASLFIAVRRSGQDTSELAAYPWAPLAFIAATVLFSGLAAMRQPWQMLAAIVTIVSGTCVYLLVRRRQQAN